MPRQPVKDYVTAPEQRPYESGVATSTERNVLGPYFDELIRNQQQMRSGALDDKTPVNIYYPGEGAKGTFTESGAFDRDAHQRQLQRLAVQDLLEKLIRPPELPYNR